MDNWEKLDISDALEKTKGILENALFYFESVLEREEEKLKICRDYLAIAQENEQKSE